MTETEYHRRIDALITKRDALWAQYDALAAAHGVWSAQAEAALVHAGNAADAVDALEREYRVELER